MNIQSIQHFENIKKELRLLEEHSTTVPLIVVNGIALNSESGFEIFLNLLDNLPPSFEIAFEFDHTHMTATRCNLEDTVSVEMTPFNTQYNEFASALSQFIESNKIKPLFNDFDSVYDVLEKMYHSVEVYVPSILQNVQNLMFKDISTQEQQAILSNTSWMQLIDASKHNVQDACHNFNQVLNDIIWLEDDMWLLFQLTEQQGKFNKEYNDALELLIDIMKFGRHIANITELSLDEVTLTPIKTLKELDANFQFSTTELNKKTIGACSYLVEVGEYGINGEHDLSEHQDNEDFDLGTDQAPLTINADHVGFLSFVITDSRWTDLNESDENKKMRLIEAWNNINSNHWKEAVNSDEIQNILYG